MTCFVSRPSGITLVKFTYVTPRCVLRELIDFVVISVAAGAVEAPRGRGFPTNCHPWGGDDRSIVRGLMATAGGWLPIGSGMQRASLSLLEAFNSHALSFYFALGRPFIGTGLGISRNWNFPNFVSTATTAYLVLYTT